MNNILYLPIIPFHNRIVQRPHHLAALFGRNGHAVHYIDAHRKGHSIRDVSPGVVEHRIGHAQYQCFKHNRLQTAAIARELTALKPDVIIVNAPYWADVALRLKTMTGARIVYDILDHFAGFEDLAPNEDRLNVAHENLVEAADLVTHTAMCLKPDHPNTLYLPNACEFEHWDRPREPGGKPGYFGVLAHWFDWDIIDTLKEHVDDVDLIGAGSKRGVMAYSDLPDATKDWGCGIIPFKDLQITRSTNPVKLYEYMALGLPVVATDLEEIRYMASQMPEDIRPELAGIEGDWPIIIDRVIDEDTPELIEERKTWAKTQTWTSRYLALELCLST